MFRLDHDRGVARLTLSRGGARNAIPVSGWPRLAEAAEAAARSGARLLVVAGEGDAFCAGADISDFAGMRGDEAAVADFRSAMRGAFGRLRALPVPVLAAIHGPCFAAGVALAMACDLRFAGAGARFAITPAKFGISYPQDDIAALVRLVGPGQAARLLFGAQPIDAAEALRIGLADLPLDALDGFVESVLANSPESLAALKRGIVLRAAADAEQDRRFDALLASDAPAGRLAALGRAKGVA